ncbi:MAG: branched-chain amino acid ABC transporter permease [Dehalococcoidales bacterium]|nr:branched-chain amino acid ABC transporter permease [Dehalococcoidales bacterium]
MIVQNLLNGLMSGWIYILVALGLTLILSIVGIVQLAHGEIYMLGSYVVYYLLDLAGLNYYAALMVSIVLVGLLGVFLERFFLRRFRGNIEGSIICTVAFIIILQTAVVAIAGQNYKSISNPIEGVLVIFGARLSWERLMVIVVSVVLVVALLYFINRSRIGQAMVAVSEDKEGAALMGINVNRISALAMFLGCGLAAAAGGLIGAMFNMDPYMGGFALNKGIAVIILGGLGSISGAIIGGLILGLIDGMVTPYLSIQLASITGLIIVILILLFRPKGLLGHD